MTARVWLGGLVIAATGACIDSPDICPSIERLLLPSGTSSVTTGGWVTGAENQTITVDEDSNELQYRFTREGATYTVRYRLREWLPPTDAGMMPTP